MKAILIDVHKQEVKEVDFDGNHKSIYSLIDCLSLIHISEPTRPY
mgnify:CR=1 FL=1